MRIDWKDNYKIGNSDIDAQHEQWFEEINQFLEATDKESLVVCEMQMYRYTRVHFAHEEKLMKSISYPDLETHVRQHNELLAKLNEIAFQIADDTLDRQVWKKFLSNWLQNHIANTDTKLAAFVKSN
jgi:hemerythrin